jgi:N-methylhydantoinase B
MTADPVTLEVVRNKLDGIANEMQVTLVRSAFSPVVKESMDASSGLFMTDGTTLAQALALPIHLGTLVPMVAAILRKFPLAGMAPGDIYAMNEPYAGGTHLPDIALVMPVFFGDAAIGLSCALCHHQDIGGMAPGSVPTNATEIFQEGIRIPPLKLMGADGWNETLLDILRLNVRLPAFFMGDLNAQVAACRTGARRMADLAAVHGAEALLGIFEELVRRSEALTRAAIRALPQGRFRYVDYLDNDGVELDRRVRIEVAAIVDGDTVTFDFTGSSPQTTGPINCVPSGAMAAAFFAIRALTGAQIPTNGGCFRPVTLILPEGSVMNPRPPAAVNTRTVTVKMAANCMVGALRQAMPDRLPASDAAIMNGIVWSGTRADGGRFVLSEMIAGGAGARPDRDGPSAIETDVTNCMNLPVEVLELTVPIRVHRVALRDGSGGAGRHRGGRGMLREYEMLHGPIRVGHRGERFYSQAAGLAGGGPGASGTSLIRRADGRDETIPSKREFTLLAGDRLIMQTPGGGGHGEAADSTRKESP